MSTTTIRMPEELKARVAAAAKRCDTSTHGFILEAIAEKAAQEELRADFDAVAERFVAAASAMQRDGWWWSDGAITNKSIRRQVLREMIAHRLPLFPAHR